MLAAGWHGWLSRWAGALSVVAPSPSGPFVATFEHGVLSRQWTFFIRSCSSSLSPSYLTKRKALCSKMLMVFKPVSCPGVFTRAYLYTRLASLGCCQTRHRPSPRPTPSVALPKSPPPPRHLRAPDPALHRTSFRIPRPSSPAAGVMPSTHLGEDGTCPTPAVGPVLSSGQGSRGVCLTGVILQQAEIAGDGQQQPRQALAAGSVTGG